MGDDLQNHEKWANVWNLRKEDNIIDTWLIALWTIIWTVKNQMK